MKAPGYSDNVKIIFFLTALMLLSFGCFGPRKAIDPYYSLHGLADAGKLRYDGFVVGIEKRNRDRIQAPPEGYPGIAFPDSFSNVSEVETNWRHRDYRSLTDDPKILYVTHVLQYEKNNRSDSADINVSDIFNAYRRYHLPPFGESQRSYSLLDSALTAMLARGAEQSKPYTHVLVFSMGWNTDQYQAVNRINRIADSLSAVSRREPERPFRPMVVALTWPSVWLKGSESAAVRSIGHISSYFNKANDADEIGYSIANKLIHQVILPKKEMASSRSPLKVVLIGHSLGARLLSRAIFSRPLLKEGPAKPACDVDLFLGLQPAFSANRFIAGKGGEGSPYSGFRELNTVFALTTSVNDRANQKALIAFGSMNLGSQIGLNAAREYPDLFRIVEWKGPEETVLPQSQATVGTEKFRSVLILDASRIVTDGSSLKPSGEYASAHNDIFDIEMAELIWKVIKTFTIDR